MPSNRRGKIASSGTQFAVSLFSSFDVLPSCGRFRGCRAKHQKLKTGSDQSPGDKKTEAESDQSKFKQCIEERWLPRSSIQHIFSVFAVAPLSINLFYCSSQWASRAGLRTSQSDVLEGGTPATTQVRPPWPSASIFLMFCELSE